jgi:hypothetical protein
MTTKKSSDTASKPAKASNSQPAEVLKDADLDKASGGLKDVPKIAPTTKKPFDMGSGGGSML